MAVVSSFWAVGQASSKYRTSSQTGRFRGNIGTSNEFTTRSSFSFNITADSFGTSQTRHGVPLDLRGSTKSIRKAANKNQNQATLVTCRAAVEDAVTSILKHTIQHCLNKENDVMRGKVLDQMGRGLAALCRVSVGVAAESSAAPIPVIPELSTIREEDLEQVRRLLHLTSLPFNSTEDEDFKRLIKLLRGTSGEQDGGNRTLSASELSQIYERLSSDMIQCVGPVIMCFPELPLWAKHRAMLLPAEVAAKMALSLLTGPRQ